MKGSLRETLVDNFWLHRRCTSNLVKQGPSDYRIESVSLWDLNRKGRVWNRLTVCKGSNIRHHSMQKLAPHKGDQDNTGTFQKLLSISSHLDNEDKACKTLKLILFLNIKFLMRGRVFRTTRKRGEGVCPKWLCCKLCICVGDFHLIIC